MWAVRASRETRFDVTLERFKLITDVVSGWATILAVAVGGWWSYSKFFRKREKYPHSTLTHDLTDRILPDGTRWLHLSLVVRNEGEGLLTVDSVLTRVQQALPPPTELVAALRHGGDVLAPGETEYSWPLLKELRWGGGKEPIEIEPSESDRFEFDFFLDRSIQTVEIYSYVKNVARFDREMGWGLTTIYSLGDEHGRAKTTRSSKAAAEAAS